LATLKKPTHITTPVSKPSNPAISIESRSHHLIEIEEKFSPKSFATWQVDQAHTEAVDVQHFGAIR
jgi:hypothetical protein